MHSWQRHRWLDYMPENYIDDMADAIKRGEHEEGK